MRRQNHHWHFAPMSACGSHPLRLSGLIVGRPHADATITSTVTRALRPSACGFLNGCAAAATSWVVPMRIAPAKSDSSACGRNDRLGRLQEHWPAHGSIRISSSERRRRPQLVPSACGRLYQRGTPASTGAARMLAALKRAHRQAHPDARTAAVNRRGLCMAAQQELLSMRTDIEQHPPRDGQRICELAWV